ncbi:MAG: sorbosone dehydrogenase family protein [Armatimonadetes bacterium]|nr:sorbosone dehydrogenase family protein [Anaerolineae bacterium]
MNKQASRFSGALMVLMLTLAVIVAPAAAQDPTPVPPDGASITWTSVQPEVRPFSPEMVANLEVPAGFEVTIFAEGLENPRMMVLGADGTVYITRRINGDVVALRDADGDGVSDGTVVVASNLPLVHGITIQENRLLLAANRTLYAADINADGSLTEPQVMISDFPESGQHSARTMAFGPDGMLYINFGSTCNACGESNMENATIVQVQPDFASRSVFASGLRHTIGFGWHPVTNELWGMDHGIDSLGDDVPPEELNRIEAGSNYGWPFCYGQQVVNTFIAGAPMDMTKAEFCAASAAPVVTYQAHSAPIGMVFYTGSQFPAEYVNDAFVAMRGSWNRSDPTGYDVVRVRFDEAGQPSEFEAFLTGFLIEDGAAVFGRPAGLLVLADGSLLVGDDTNGVIYRVAYTGS